MPTKGTIITYGTFDLLHVGHLNLLESLRAMGDRLIVGVSTDEFNQEKGKQTVIPFKDRSRLVGALHCVDQVIPERSWNQKRQDIAEFGASVLGMGSDWEGRFDDLQDCCEVIYLNRTKGISSTQLKSTLGALSDAKLGDLKKALEVVAEIVRQFN
ncbi:MAG: glycerol-3-phosphate cytidylyltransferase [Nevskiaceae bacterium]|nr:MAG: glycerol-3-phosphate cytidylyltransferase [Nevskiaceae bacterium]TBR71584.1 MAG: glycerol-3-phosphate cytidylyltransferase [Nevskiaceae bacterium]